jgi:alanine racemase
LSPDYNIIRSPKSYNSQIGVPLSVIAINEQHNLGFLAGISTVSEMEKLEQIIANHWNSNKYRHSTR